MHLKVFYLALVVLVCVFGVNCDDPEVEIRQGKLRGRTRTNRDGGVYYSFESIPFAQPPIGDLRFKAPQPADGWEGTRDATQAITNCVKLFNGEGQEDCLYLNVYTPELPAANDSLKAVMVWIYGGGFITGSATESEYGSEFLLTKDVVLVAMNYRVGIFGFLSLDDPNLGVTGNAGLKDQVLALQWVKDNIEHFGGDPNNVMIFGESAGGMSVHLQVLSPMSKGLFNKAIAESGCAITDLVTPEFRNNAVVIAEELGIQTENWEEMIEALRDIPAQLLTATDLILMRRYEYFTRPIVEIASVEPTFMEELPIDIMKSGTYNQVPFIIGFNNAEGLHFQQRALQQTGQSLLITDFSEWIPGDLQIEPGSEKEEILSQKMKQFYYGDSEPSVDDITQAIDLTTDYAFGFPAFRTASEHFKTAVNPIYFYFFSADTKLNTYKPTDEVSMAFPGASHADELGYLFFSDSTPSDIEEGSVEDLGIKNLVNLWTNFAIYDNPTPEGSIYHWDPLEENQFNYLHIGTHETILKANPKPENFQFWSEVYAEYFPEKADI